MPSPNGHLDDLLWLDEPAAREVAVAAGRAATLAALAARYPVRRLRRPDGALRRGARAAARRPRRRRSTPSATSRSPCARRRSTRTARPPSSPASTRPPQPVRRRRGRAGGRALLASATTERARCLPPAPGLPRSSPARDLVQVQVVPADAPAVAFSANPVNGPPRRDRDQRELRSRREHRRRDDHA